jgi:hypothetical protein
VGEPDALVETSPPVMESHAASIEQAIGVLQAVLDLQRMRAAA